MKMNLFWFIFNIIYLSAITVKIHANVITNIKLSSNDNKGFGSGLASILRRVWGKSGVTLANCGAVGVRNFIVNGDLAQQNEYPFIVLIKFNGKTTCGGAILNQEWVLTAAHCFKDREWLLEYFTVSAGSNSIYNGDIYSISKVVVHNKFSLETMNSDISLIKVNPKFNLSSKVSAICLPKVRLEDPTGTLTVAGWGRLKFKANASDTLQKVVLPVITDQQCSNIYANKRIAIYRSNLCTFVKGKDTCEGDSGGPAFQHIDGRATLVGVVSFGWECADQYPGVYTQVSYFLDWIEENAK